MCARHLTAAPALCLALLLVACSASPPGRDFQPAAPDDAVPTAAGPSFAAGAVPPALQACATETLDRRVRTVDLVIMFDRSASMQERLAGSAVTRWEAASEAMKAFLASSPGSPTRASLSFFGLGVKSDEVCASTSYLTPRVPPLALPESTSFASAFASTPPGRQTPTAAALGGALLQARALREGSDHRVAVVFVTDGLPEGCAAQGQPDGEIEAAALQARAAYDAGIPTFVVGVGPRLDNLRGLARAGGTDQAYLVDAASPAETSAALTAALHSIRDRAGSCALDLPEPADGQTVDHGRINVAVKGTSTALPRVETCDDGPGWRLEQGAEPHVVLCPASCGEARSAGELTLTLGCATVVR